MKVNVDNTRIVVFSKGRLPRNLISNYNGTNIEIVKDFNYLGVYFSRTGSFKVCKNHLSEKAETILTEFLSQCSLMKYWFNHTYERPHSFNILST
jgi:hypothetical protein